LGLEWRTGSARTVIIINYGLEIINYKCLIWKVYLGNASRSNLIKLGVDVKKNCNHEAHAEKNTRGNKPLRDSLETVIGKRCGIVCGMDGIL